MYDEDHDVIASIEKADKAVIAFLAQFPEVDRLLKIRKELIR